MISQASQNPKLVTLQNKSIATVLTKSAIESLQQDLQNSIEKGRELVKNRQKKFDL